MQLNWMMGWERCGCDLWEGLRLTHQGGRRRRRRSVLRGLENMGRKDCARKKKFSRDDECEM